MGCMKTNRHTVIPALALFGAALLSSCVTTHRRAFDYGREGEGVLLKSEIGHAKLAGAEIPIVRATVYRVGGKRYVAGHPARFVRRGRPGFVYPFQIDKTYHEARPDETRTLYGEVETDLGTGCLVRTQTPWLESLPPGTVQQQPGEPVNPAGVARYCRNGVVLVTSDLHACPEALWAYPLGTVLAVADVPLTVAWDGIVVVVQGAIATYRAIVPAEKRQAEN